MIWHSHTAAEALQELNTDMTVGLSSVAAAERLIEYGENRLTDTQSTVWHLFVRRMKSATAIVVILIAAIVLGISAYGYVVNLTPIEWIAPVTTIVVVVLSAILGAIQDSRGDTELRSLRDLSAPEARVRRDGQRVTVPAYTLVPGDILELTAGDRAPADCRLLETRRFTCDESLLTGNTGSIDKDANTLYENIAPLAERTNMIYAGCAVTGGEATAVVVATGVQSEMGHIAAKPQDEQQKDVPLRDRMARINKLVGLLTVAVCVIVAVVALLLHIPLTTALMTVAALAVAASPDGLIPAVTLALTRGARRSAEDNAVIRRSAVIETLGNVTVIGTDGAEMFHPNDTTLTHAFVHHQALTLSDDISTPGLQQLLQLAVLCADTDTENGSSTDAAILSYAARVGADRERLLDDMPRVGEFPYSSTHAVTTAIHRADSATVIIVKGEPEAVFSHCTRGHIEEAADACDAMTKESLQVVAVAYKILREAPAAYTAEELECNLTLAGLFGLTEPLPTDAVEAVCRCEEAGIHTVIMTKDRLQTAVAAARKIGILQTDDEAVTGDAIAAMSDDELDAAVARCRVYAQLSPSAAVRIVEAFNRRGDVVAITGHNADDAPVLKAADVGCAMKTSGTDVAKNAADVILINDRYESVFSAVREGRGISDAIRKVIHYLLSCRLGAVIAVIVATLVWRDSALFPIHLLWINLITAVLCAPSLGVEPPSNDVMHRTPHSVREALLTRRLTWQAILEGALFAALTLIAYYVGAVVWANAALGATMAFATLAIVQIVHPFSVRSPRSLFVVGCGGNRSMLLASAAALALVLAVLLIPGVQGVFSLTGMNLAAWGVVLCLAVEPLILSEACKGIRKMMKK